MRISKKQRWIPLLWAWWGLSLVLFLVLWSLALVSQYRCLLQARQLEMLECLRHLSSQFAEFSRLQEALRSSLSAGPTGLKPLRLARTQAEPFFQIYWLRPSGQSVLAEDQESPPPWLPGLLASQQALARPGLPLWIRPLPPGLLAGRSELALDPRPPDNYLLACSPLPPGWLVFQVDLEEIFDSWLPRQIERMPLASDLRLRRLAPDQGWGQSAADEPLAMSASLGRLSWSALSDSREWSWQLATFLAEDPFPFDRLELTLDNRPVLRAHGVAYLLALGAGLVLMLSFAASIRLAAHNLRREWEVVQERQEFTAMVSHELRTPVAAISLYSDILSHQLVTDSQKMAEYYRILGEQSARLERMVENLLAMGSLEKGAARMKLEEVDLTELVEAGLEWLSKPGFGGRDSVKWELKPAIARVRADRQASLHALTNLLHNALKYGGGEVSVVIEGSTIGVLDRGPGVPTELRQKIFEPYRRLPSSFAGVGLGLALVDRLMQAQGGSVSLAERPGGGSVFTLHFESL